MSALFQSTPHGDKMLSQLVDVMDSGPIHTLLHHWPDGTVNRVEVRWVMWPQVWSNEVWSTARKQLNRVPWQCAGALSCWKVNMFPETRRSTPEFIAPHSPLNTCPSQFFCLCRILLINPPGLKLSTLAWPKFYAGEIIVIADYTHWTRSSVTCV